LNIFIPEFIICKQSTSVRAMTSAAFWLPFILYLSYMTLTIAANRYLLASCLLATFIRSPPSSFKQLFKKGEFPLSEMCSWKISLDSAVRS